MKKILFGICALALSASAFGAVSSEITGTGTDGKAKVTLPVELKANVVSGSKYLFIEGESGNTFGDILELNFGDITQGRNGETSGSIRVYRGLDTDNNNEKVAFGGTLKVAFEGLDPKTAGNDVDFKEGAVATTTLINTTPNDQGQVDEKAIHVTLESTGIRGGETDSTEYRAKVKATTEKIKAPADHPVGKYTGAFNITASLTGVDMTK